MKINNWHIFSPPKQTFDDQLKKIVSLRKELTSDLNVQTGGASTIKPVALFLSSSSFHNQAGQNSVNSLQIAPGAKH
eukprot:766400-Hanusia_phi.AAC.3